MMDFRAHSATHNLTALYRPQKLDSNVNSLYKPRSTHPLRRMPMSDPIIGALTGVASKAIAQTTASLVDKISLKFAKDKYDVIRFVLNKGLPAYLEANYAKCETLKTLLNRNDPIPLEDCFVAPDFHTRGEISSSAEFLEDVNQSGAKVVITGLAGSGKSVFLKYSFRRVIEKGYSYYPIFFELRSLNSVSAKSGILLSEVFSSINSCCDAFTRVQFKHGLGSGAFYFLLDGFDELRQELRDLVGSEITNLARTHHKCAIVVSSRPSDDFVSWEGFAEAALQPFDLDKVIDYISKLKFDEEKKKDFLTDLQEGLFEKNKDFLSNPLLSAMMLLTYDAFGEIPAKRHIFYSKCFDVLAREHDASKGRYKRELFSKLAIDNLEHVFMYFCALSYVDRQFSFSEQEVPKYVRRAISACGIEEDVQPVIKDFRESISILERVGLIYEFAHRSFQEYFYAKFVVADRKLSLERKIGWLCDNVLGDDTLEMIADMDRSYFEDEFLLPRLRELDGKLGRVDIDTNPAGILSKFYATIQMMRLSRNVKRKDSLRLVYTASSQANLSLYHQACWNYRDQIPLDVGGIGFAEDDSKRMASIVQNRFGGKIKIHHTNNAKLIEAGGVKLAEKCRHAISCLRQHLEEKQDRRQHGLAEMIRRNYA